MVLLNQLQSTLVISKSKGPSKTLWDIRTSTYQMCRTEENTNRTTKFQKWASNLTPLIRNICWKYCGKWLPLSTIFYYLMLDLYVKTGIRFSLRDKRLFEITEVEITRVDCLCFHWEIRKIIFELSSVPPSYLPLCVSRVQPGNCISEQSSTRHLPLKM